MLKIKGFQFNMFGEMTYVVYDEISLKAAVIDPGMMNSREAAELDDFIMKNRLSIQHIVATHIHIDHVMGLSRVIEKTGLGLEANRNDEFLSRRIAEQADMFRLPVKIGPIKINRYLEPGDRIDIGDDYLLVIHVPGHSPGSIALYSPSSSFVITGDALFDGSIGRTDLPGGDYPTLIKSITDNLMSLPDDTAVYPGHGDSTTIGKQRRVNPFL
ncbi:MAG: MBL fold metallo-hydrolase [Muribaculaceae bacterium]|nr:MBL fold metallo-hydrolase [Muribaculaceae bacterium]